MRREGNEDAYCVRADLGLYLVADGMGGHAAGEIASKLAAETIEGVIRDTRNADVNTTWPMTFDISLSINGNRLKTAFHMANRRLTTAMEGVVVLNKLIEEIAKIERQEEALETAILKIRTDALRKLLKD